MSVSSLFLVLIAVVVVYAAWKKKIPYPASFFKADLDIIHHNKKYNKFKINTNLQANLENALDGLLEEYGELEKFDKQNIAPKVTFEIAKANPGLNRYKDMVPYDNNIAKLKAPIGKQSLLKTAK